MRQFDVIVWGYSESEPIPEPAFTDPALGWFFGNDLNESLARTDAEWIVIAHKSVNIDRNFLNDLAQAVEGYPMVDAFAPRIKNGEKFYSGFKLFGRHGLTMLGEDATLQFVASPHPLIAAYSRRIIQRTGRVDQDFPIEESLVDYTLRMYHAGGKMFSLPFLVSSLKQDFFETADTLLSREYSVIPLAQALYKSFGFTRTLSFMLTHFQTFSPLWKKRKELDAKREAAILLSKLKKNTLSDITLTGKQ